MNSLILWLCSIRMFHSLVWLALPLIKELNQVDTNGRAFFEPLISLNDTKVVDLLLNRGWKPDQQTLSGWNCLTIAVDTEAHRSLKKLLDRGVPPDLPNANGMTALMIACRQNNLAAVDILIASGANPNARDKDGWTAAHWTMHKHRAKTETVMSMLRVAGADFEILDSCNQSCMQVVREN